MFWLVVSFVGLVAWLFFKLSAFIALFICFLFVFHRWFGELNHLLVWLVVWFFGWLRPIVSSFISFIYFVNGLVVCFINYFVA